MNLVQGAYKSFSDGDIPAVLAIMNDAIEWHEPKGFIYNGTFCGQEDILNNVFLKLGTEWTNWQATPEEFIEGGETNVVLGHYSGTFNETGKNALAPFAHIWKIKNGKVIKFRTYMDTVMIQRTTG
ncbi:MAG: nuclear transport factor 2 family protein [Aestuariibacter sp.]